MVLTEFVGILLPQVTPSPLVRLSRSPISEAKLKRLEELDGWIRHKLGCILWPQRKRPYTRAMNLMKAGRAWRSACNQRGPWSSGSSHMNQAFPKSFFDRLGLRYGATRNFVSLTFVRYVE